MLDGSCRFQFLQKLGEVGLAYESAGADLDRAEIACLLLAGENKRAARLADRLEREFTNPDGTPTNPMRISEIEGSRALIALRDGDLRRALVHANNALDVPRRSNPSLLRATDQLASEFARHRHDARVVEFLRRRRALLG